MVITNTHNRMHTKYKYLFTLLAFCLGLPAALGYVMGPDNRVEVADQQSQLAAVRQTGMIRIEAEEFVSGLLTGANCDVVISAGHAAIYWESVARKGWLKGALRGQGMFRFNLDPKTWAAWLSMALVNSGYEQADNVGKDEHDWSIFRLNAPALPACEIVRVMPAGADCEGDLLMTGFHFDKPETKLLEQGCSLKNTTDKGLIVHDCDSKDGSSGAPLFCRDNAKLSLLAINISGLASKDYFDAGVYGKSGSAFNERQHKNFAIAIGGAFYRALILELKASAERRLLVD